MQRTHLGAARHLPAGRPGTGAPPSGERAPLAARASGRPLSRINVLSMAAGALLPRNAEGDVILLDARSSRPSVVYRSIVRIRSAGWDKGIVLMIDPDDLSMVAVAYSVGATDFVIGTAAPDEVDVRLRRAASAPAGAPGIASLEDSGIQLHWRTHRVSFEGTTITLTHREMQLLSVLMEQNGDVVTAGDLTRSAWGKRSVRGDLAAAFVCSLRKKLAWFGGRFGIQTVRGVGYRFVFSSTPIQQR